MKKILIVYNGNKKKHKDIIKECKNRDVECEMISHDNLKIEDLLYADGIIIEMGESSQFLGTTLMSPGERVLQCMESAICRVPTLVISKVGLHSQYVFVHSIMEECDAKDEKFLEFIKEIKMSVS